MEFKRAVNSAKSRRFGPVSTSSEPPRLSDLGVPASPLSGLQSFELNCGAIPVMSRDRYTARAFIRCRAVHLHGVQALN